MCYMINNLSHKKVPKSRTNMEANISCSTVTCKCNKWKCNGLFYYTGDKCTKGSSNYLCGFTNPNNVRIYKSEQCSDFGGWVGLRKLDVHNLAHEIICTPRNPIIIERCTDFLGAECSDLRAGG